ncbi:hypothetical protein MTO96_013177 [Rhipicephalus appendiculatus]
MKFLRPSKAVAQVDAVLDQMLDDQPRDLGVDTAALMFLEYLDFLTVLREDLHIAVVHVTGRVFGEKVVDGQPSGKVQSSPSQPPQGVGRDSPMNHPNPEDDVVRLVRSADPATGSAGPTVARYCCRFLPR